MEMKSKEPLEIVQKNEFQQKVYGKWNPSNCLEIVRKKKLVACHKMPKPTHKKAVELKDYASKMCQKKNI